MAEEAAEADEDPTLREVKWGLPEGLKVLEKPTKLDDALLGMIIFMRWAAPRGCGLTLERHFWYSAAVRRRAGRC